MDFNVEKIAKLAKIKINSQEKIILEKNIEDIIHMLEKLNNVDTDNIKDNIDDMKEMYYREDVVQPSMMSSQALIKNAPKSIAGCIIVPKTIE